VRIYRTVFELIKKNDSRKRHIDNVSGSGKKDMRALFQERCWNRIQITGVTQVKDDKLGGIHEGGK